MLYLNRASGRSIKWLEDQDNSRDHDQVTRAHSLRSADTWICAVHHIHNQFGDRCFAAAGPSLWNILPQQLIQPDTSSDHLK
jgi:hypothetical protein